MSVEFDPFSRDEQPAELLPVPVSRRRRWMRVAGAVVIAAALGGGAFAIATNSASAAPGLVPAGVATATPSASGSAKPSGSNGSDRRGAFAPGTGNPVLFGTVKSASGVKILITDPQGFTRAIITSAKTQYKDGLTATPAAGAKITAEGVVDADGVSLDAAVIGALPQFGGPGGMRPGGAGGPRPTGARPTGVPTGAPTGAPTGNDRHVPRPSATPTPTAAKS